MAQYILALDQGTTSSRAIVFDEGGRIVSEARKEFTQIYPKPGWVEHNAVEIWGTQIGVAYEAIAKANIAPSQLQGIGITNQRETTVVWERSTGRPIANAIVWQCRRTAAICEELKKQGLSEIVRRKTGLEIDAYFSATKIKWLLENIPGAREKAQKGELCFGTIDTWLIWNLTKGRVFVTDYSNASRTMLFNIHTLSWDEELCEIFGVPMSLLPEVKAFFLHLRRNRLQHFGSCYSHRRLCRRPAGSVIRAVLHRAGGSQEHLWHRLLHAHEHR